MDLSSTRKEVEDNMMEYDPDPLNLLPKMMEYDPEKEEDIIIETRDKLASMICDYEQTVAILTRRNIDLMNKCEDEIKRRKSAETKLESLTPDLTERVVESVINRLCIMSSNNRRLVDSILDGEQEADLGFSRNDQRGFPTWGKLPLTGIFLMRHNSTGEIKVAFSSDGKFLVYSPGSKMKYRFDTKIIEGWEFLPIPE